MMTSNNNQQGQRGAAIVAEKEAARALDVFWFLKPCTLASWKVQATSVAEQTFHEVLTPSILKSVILFFHILSFFIVSDTLNQSMSYPHFFEDNKL